MRKILFALTMILFFILSIACFDAVYWPKVAQLIPEKYTSHDSVVTIKGLKNDSAVFYGSGYVIDRDKNIVKTAYHVVELSHKNSDIDLAVIYEGKDYKASILTVDTAKDLATIVITSSNNESVFNKHFDRIFLDDRFQYAGQRVYLKGVWRNQLTIIPGIVLTENQVKTKIYETMISLPIRTLVMWDFFKRLKDIDFLKRSHYMIIKTDCPFDISGMSGGVVLLNDDAIGTISQGECLRGNTNFVKATIN